MATDGNEVDDFDEDLPRSVRNNKPVKILFLNKTVRDVYVIWLDFAGKRVIYATLNPRSVIPMYTYEQHPWIFEDTRTGDRMLCDGQEIFIPKYNSSERNLRSVTITSPCYSLRKCALQTIRDSVDDVDSVDSSEIPDILLDDIKRAINLKQRMLDMYERCSHS